MRFKEIKPGMVIHCPKEEDARVLLEHLANLKYDIEKSMIECAYSAYGDKTCFFVNRPSMFYHMGKPYLSYGDVYTYKHPEKDDDFANCVFTEFSDLIEPDSPMGAVKVLEWFKNAKPWGDIEKVFGCDICNNPLSLEGILEVYKPEEIVQKITAYEAAKKAPKPVDVEWVDVARIIKIGDMGRSVCVCERDIVGTTDDDLVKQGIEIALREYIAEHEGKYFAVHQKQCRVKEDK